MAEALAAEGAAIGLVARDPEGLAAAARRLSGLGAPIATAAADVMDPQLLNRAAELIRAGLPHLRAANVVVDGGQRYPSARRFD